MADENPSSTAPQDDESDKKETIRITLPPKSDEPVAKRETVRVNVPGAPDSGPAPKKETSKVTLPASGAMPPPPMSRPSTPPAPPPLSRPLSGVSAPPKPPPFSAKPTVPLRPAPPASGAAPQPAAPVSGVITKPSSPKKETARISLPTETPKSGAPALPKATVKMQQTQPLTKSQPSASRPPQSGITAVSTPAVSLAAAPSTSPAQADNVEKILGIAALVGSIAALAFAFLAFKAAELPSWAQ
jgi:hypothetical protein